MNETTEQQIATPPAAITVDGTQPVEETQFEDKPGLPPFPPVPAVTTAMNDQQLVAHVVRCVREGKTAQQAAEAASMKLTSFVSRTSTLRSKLKAANPLHILPSFPRGRSGGGKSTIEETGSVLAGLLGLPVASDEPEEETESDMSIE